MKVYEITIRPLSGFGTPLKGDTLFGQFCWQALYDNSLLGASVEELLQNYDGTPFIVFSSAYIKLYEDGGSEYSYVLRRPALPPRYLKANIDQLDYSERKSFKKREWWLVHKKGKIESLKEGHVEYISSKDLWHKLRNRMTAETRDEVEDEVQLFKPFKQPHNTINRLSGTTGTGAFAPYVSDVVFYPPETKLSIFVGIEESEININGVCEVLERIGELGFGKDASIGMGRFELVNDAEEIDLRSMGSDSPNACYTLSPCVPQKDVFSTIYALPFVRFGKHGDVRARAKNPFKNPVIMADEGGVLKVNNNDVFSKPYIGTSLRGLSKIFPDTVGQGYSLYIPVKLEEQ